MCREAKKHPQTDDEVEEPTLGIIIPQQPEKCARQATRELDLIHCRRRRRRR